MSGRLFITTADPATVGRLVAPLAFASMRATTPLATAMADDHSVSPADMTCALIEMHLAGAASAIGSACASGVEPEQDRKALARRAADRLERLILAGDRLDQEPPSAH